MGRYSIADLENLSGIKAHTIRIWEQRYGLLQPERTKTNIRYYDDEQLKKLLNISVLLKQGIKISQVSSLADSEIDEILEKHSKEQSTVDVNFNLFIHQLITSGLSFNEIEFDRVFSTCILRFGLGKTYEKILYPFLEKLGVLWCRDQVNPAQEHFLSNLIRQKILTAIDGIPPIPNSKSSFILFLHEEEDHEIGLLFANYLLRSHKIKVIYLGQRVPEQNLLDAVQTCKPSHLMTFITKHQNKSITTGYLKRLSNTFPKQKIIVSGNPLWLQGVSLPSNVTWIKTIEEFKKVIEGKSIH
jgi:DNA-binding transcriptional MerR regulator